MANVFENVFADMEVDDDATVAEPYNESMATHTLKDTLIIKLMDYDVDTRELDHTLFVMYDADHEMFLIRGKRHGLDTYSFCCDKLNRTIDFLMMLLNQTNISYGFHNLKNLPTDLNQTTYKFLKSNAVLKTELSGYDHVTFSSAQMTSLLKLLIDIYN